MKKVIIVLLSLIGILVAASVWADVSGIGGVAARAKSNLADLAKLITAGSYVGGLAFVIGAIVKFKAHKDNPAQIPIGTPIALLFVGAALIFVPSVYSVSGATLFASPQVGGVSGITSFGKGKSGGPT